MCMCNNINTTYYLDILLHLDRLGYCYYYVVDEQQLIKHTSTEARGRGGVMNYATHPPPPSPSPPSPSPLTDARYHTQYKS